MAELATSEQMGKAELQALVTMALDEAKTLGVDQAEVAASQDSGLAATARLGDVENLEFTNDRGLGITVYKNARKGNANTSDVSPAAIRETVAKACSFATLTAPDPHSGLADAELMAQDIADLDLDHPWAITADEAIAMAIEAEAAALGYDKRISNSEGGTVSTNRGTRVYGNSHGFLGAYSRSSHSITAVVLAESDGTKQRDYHYTSSRVAEHLQLPSEVGELAAQKTLARLGAVKIKTRNAPVLYVPELARALIGHSIGAISGGAQYRKSSFLLDAVGQTLFPEFVQIQERPHLAQAMSSRPYDAEGVATYDRDIVADGVLQGYVLSSYSARRLGLTSTANAGGTQNLIVPGGDKDKAALIKEMHTGLIVEELIGQGVNPVTGDYSRGAVGHWVENGEIQHAVHEVTIAGNLRDLYRRIAAIGSDQDTRGGIRCGSILVEEMTIAGA